MSGSGLLLQLLNGLADASALFLVAAGLSLIFGVTRVVNFAHGSFYMLGIYLAWTFTGYFGGGAGYWAGLLLAALATGLIGAAAERLVLSRLYARPSCSSCWPPSRCCSSSATPRWPWGPEVVLRPRPRPRGRGRDPGPPLPAIRPAAHRRRPDRAGPAVAAADAHALGPAAARRLGESMLAALGVNQAWLFTSAFTLGAFLEGLGGALAAPRTPATLGLDLEVIASAFVVVVVGRPARSPAPSSAAADQPGQVPVRVPGPGADRPLGLQSVQADAAGRIRGHGRGAGGAAPGA